jgi:hypothetical protein
MTGADHILTTDELKARLGCETAGELKRMLRKDGIVYFGMRDHPWTTLDMINAAGRKKMGEKDGAENDNNEEGVM